MAKTIKVDDLTKAIVDTLKDFENATEDSIEVALKKGTEYALKELHNAKPAGSGVYGSWDEYNKSWTSVQKTNSKQKFKYVTIHNKKHYRLTHLLEKGHKLAKGGEAKAFEHIAPIADKTEEVFMDEVKREIRS